MQNQNSKFKVVAIAVLALAITSLPLSSAHAGSYFGHGMLVGTIGGFVGTSVGYYLYESSKDDYNSSDWDGTLPFLSMAIGIGGAIGGGLLGGGIGAMFKKESGDTYWLRGLLIGSIGLGTLGALTSYGLYHGSSDSVPIAAIAGGGGAIVGGLIGTGIGAMTEKTPKVSVVPTISPSKDGNTTYGLGINGRF